MRSYRNAIVPALFSLLFALTGQAHAQAGDFAGRWTRDAEASTPMTKIVEDGMARLGKAYRVWPISGQAKKRLQATNKPYGWISIVPNGDMVTVETDSYKLTTPKNGTLKRWERTKGDFIDVTSRWESGRLEQVFEAEDGRRVNVYTVGPNGALNMDVTVTSPKLSSPLTYRMVYRK